MKPTEHAPIDQVYTINEAATMIGVSPETLRRRIKEGKIKMLRMSPARVGIRSSEVQRFLDAAEAI